MVVFRVVFKLIRVFSGLGVLDVVGFSRVGEEDGRTVYYVRERRYALGVVCGRVFVVRIRVVGRWGVRWGFFVVGLRDVGIGRAY